MSPSLLSSSSKVSSLTMQKEDYNRMFCEVSLGSVKDRASSITQLIQGGFTAVFHPIEVHVADGSAVSTVGYSRLPCRLGTTRDHCGSFHGRFSLLLLVGYGFASREGSRFAPQS